MYRYAEVEGDSFGEGALFGESSRGTDARAAESGFDTTLLVLDQGVFAAAHEAGHCTS
jgi:CRP-like cAMP-binding protein